MSIINLILPFALFLITMIIVFSMRLSDKKNNRISRLHDMKKQLTDIADAEINNLQKCARQVIEQINMQIAGADECVRTMDSKVSDLKRKSEELSMMHEAMVEYQKTLTKLASITNQVEQKIDSVNRKVDEVKQVSAVIDSFHESVEREKDELNNIIVEATRTMETVEETALSRMNEISSALDEKGSESCERIQLYNENVKKTLAECESQLALFDQSVCAKVERYEQDADLKLEQVEKKTGAVLDQWGVDFENLTSDMEQKASSIHKIADTLEAQLSGQGERLKNDLEQVLETGQSRIGEMERTLDENEARSKEMVETLQSRFEELEAGNLKRMNRELDAFSGECVDRLQAIFSDTVKELSDSYEKLSGQGNRFLEEFGIRIEESKKMVDALESSSTETIASLSDAIAAYVKKMGEHGSSGAPDLSSGQKSAERISEKTVNSLDRLSRRKAESLTPSPRKAGDVLKSFGEIRGESEPSGEA